MNLSVANCTICSIKWRLSVSKDQCFRKKVIGDVNNSHAVNEVSSHDTFHERVSVDQHKVCLSDTLPFGALQYSLTQHMLRLHTHTNDSHTHTLGNGYFWNEVIIAIIVVKFPKSPKRTTMS